jgi:hypothetical protein
MIILKESTVQEKLISATKSEFEQLKKQIEHNPMLRKQLTTNLGKLPQYQYLYEMDWVDDITLLNMLEFIDRENLFTLKFVKSGNNFTGFLAYKDEGRKISKIKIASFYDDQIKANKTIVEDLLQFIEAGMLNHDIIEWSASKANPANALYIRAIPAKFPQYQFNREWSSRLNRWVYTLIK